MVLVLCAPLTVVSQQTLKGRIADESSGEPLPYAAIGVKNSINGTITNENGAFELVNIELGDTLVFRHLGYNTRFIAAKDFPENGEILIGKKTYDIPVFTVFGESDIFYEWLSKCRKALRRAGEKECRAYIEIRTDVASKPAEVIEMYYNASVESGSLQNLQFKSGRQSLAEVDNSYFLSLSMSKVFQIFNLTHPEKFLPINPLSQTKSGMKKQFEISRLTPEGSSDLHFAFRPKSDGHKLFSGDIWISQDFEAPLEVTLEIDSAAIHPFIPAFKSDSISDISMKITQRFKIENGEPIPELLRFQYTLNSFRKVSHELDPNGILPPKRKEVVTEGVLYFYDYADPFVLPFFNYPEGINDYQRLQNTPYNHLFWRNNQVFVESKQQQERSEFFKQNGIFRNNEIGGQKFLEATNKVWNRHRRLRFSNQPIARSKDYGYSDAGVTRRSQYNLHIQLFLDLVETDSRWKFESKTVLDVFRSYFDLKTDSLTDPFLNIYFDLAEIQRRKMESDLMSAPVLTPKIAAEIHAKHVNTLNRTLEDYERDTGSGQWISELKKWNEFVKEELNLDNFEILGIRLH